MPKKRESQPVQIWLSNFDRLRLMNAAKSTGRTQSDLAREGIRRLLDEIDSKAREQSKSVDMFEGFTPAAQKVVSFAQQESHISGKPLTGAEHLLLALAADTEEVSGRLLSKVGVTYKITVGKVAALSWFETDLVATDQPFQTRFLAVVERARKIAKHLRDKLIEPEHLLLSLLAEEIGITYEVLDIIGIDRAELRAEVMKAKALKKQENQRKAKKKRRGAR